MSVQSSGASSSWWSNTSPVGQSTTKSSKDKENAIAGLVGLLLEIGAIIVTSYVASLFLTKLLKPFQGEGEPDAAAMGKAENRLVKLLEKQGKDSSALELSNHERQIAQDVIDPDDIATSFSDIGGIDDIKQELWELAVLPLQRPDLFQESHLLTQPTGILLYGQPGTGKTMLAKAIAREANATFVAVRLSTLMSKWFGESNKIVSAIFSLSRKLAPAVIFIDELDTFLNPRDGSNEGGAGNAIKAEFLTLWDGITTRQDQKPVIVLGATNRPNSVDSAILRRFPRQFRIALPTQEGRLQILRLTLEGHPLAKEAKKYLPTLARDTIGYSGSDLKELCHCAARESIREVMKETARKAVMTKSRKSTENGSQNGKQQISKAAMRPMLVKDLKIAKTKVKRTGQDATEYEREQFQKDHRDQNNGQKDMMMQQLAALSQLLSQQNSIENGKNDDDSDNIPQL
ncbi:MAG: hypothetical protein SGBAC_012264 [Bacillariaceae sp.]